MRKPVFTFLILHTILYSSAPYCAAEEIAEAGAVKNYMENATDGSNDTQPTSESAQPSSDNKHPTKETSGETQSQPVQTGPLIDIFGQQLLSMEMIDETSAELRANLTSDALRNKKVIGVYFSADWCGPCRQFTPELVSFYNKMNNRRGKKDEFEIVWVSRCRDVNAYGQYFTQMPWIALPPEEAMGERAARLSEKYKVKGIPTLVLLDELGNVITTDGRNKIPNDKAGIGFPWRNPLATFYMTVVPRSLRYMVKAQISGAKEKVFARIKGGFDRRKKAKA